VPGFVCGFPGIRVIPGLQGIVVAGVREVQCGGVKTNGDLLKYSSRILQSQGSFL